MTFSTFALSLAALAMLGTPTGSSAGVFPDRIVIGQACALKGPAGGLGRGMNAGLKASFQHTNDAGGIKGRKIELLAENDSYEPESCEAATRKLVEESGVFLMIGGVGTPTAKAAVPYCEKNDVPFVAPFTGAEFLRNPFKPEVVNLRASYYQETERLCQLLVDERKLSHVACFYQNDAFGQAGLAGMEKALERRGAKLVATGTYERNTTAIETGLTAVAAGKPDAIVLVGTYKACAAFMKAAAANPDTQKAQFCNISFVGTMDLLAELGGAGEGSIVSQVVPFPWDQSVPVVAEYHESMKAAGLEADVGFTSLEGYLAGNLFSSVIEKIDGDPTREAFLATIDKVGKFDLGGVHLNFGPDDHQGMDDVYLTVIKGGKIEPLK
jgi:ABC-type branched-subunit amino acid transport system substrate-binding protein